MAESTPRNRTRRYRSGFITMGFSMIFHDTFSRYRRMIAAVFIVGISAGPAIAEAPASSSSLQGTFLVAAPGSQGPFQQTAILVIGHDDDGAAGVVVNRATDRTLADILANEPSDKAADYNIFSGGPIRPRALSVLQRTEPDADVSGMRTVTPAMSYSINSESIDAVLEQAPAANQVRFFAGYTAWDADQLEREISSGAWLITTAKAADIFETEPDTLWARLMERITGRSGPAMKEEGGDL